MGRTKAERPRRRVGARYFYVDGQQPPAPSLGPLEQSLLPAELLAVAVGSTSSQAPAAPMASVQQQQVSAATDQAAAASRPIAAVTTTIEAAALPSSSLPLAPVLALRSEDLGLPSPSTSHDEVDDLRSDEEPRKDSDTAPLDDAMGAGDNKPISVAQSESSAQETVTLTLQELETWKQQVHRQIEDHYSNEQLKRIAEFGRVHASLLCDAKEYVYNIEMQLQQALERDRADLRAQAEAYVAQTMAEKQQLAQEVDWLRNEVETLRSELRETKQLQAGGVGQPIELGDSSQEEPAKHKNDTEEREGAAVPVSVEDPDVVHDLQDSTL